MGTKLAVDEKEREGEVKHTCSYQLKEEADATLIIQLIQFKTYLFSVPIVSCWLELLSWESWNLMSPKVSLFRTYQGFCDLEYTKPNGLVVQSLHLLEKPLVPQQFAPKLEVLK